MGACHTHEEPTMSSQISLISEMVHVYPTRLLQSRLACAKFVLFDLSRFPLHYSRLRRLKTSKAKAHTQSSTSWQRETFDGHSTRHQQEKNV